MHSLQKILGSLHECKDIWIIVLPTPRLLGFLKLKSPKIIVIINMASYHLKIAMHPVQKILCSLHLNNCTKETYLQCTMFPSSRKICFKSNKLRSILKCQIVIQFPKIFVLTCLDQSNQEKYKFLWFSNSNFAILSIICSYSSYRRIICPCSNYLEHIWFLLNGG